MDKKLKKAINEATKYMNKANKDQVFVIKNESEEEFTFCNLKTLDHLKNDLKLNIEILFNIYRHKNQLVYDMY